MCLPRSPPATQGGGGFAPRVLSSKNVTCGPLWVFRCGRAVISQYPRPTEIIFSPVSGGKAESYKVLFCHNSFSVIRGLYFSFFTRIIFQGHIYLLRTSNRNCYWICSLCLLVISHFILFASVNKTCNGVKFIVPNLIPYLQSLNVKQV